MTSSDEDGFQLLLRAVEAQITASAERAEIRGTVPLIDQIGESFATTERTSERLSLNGEIGAIPFEIDVSL